MVSTGQLAQLLALTDRQIRNLAKSGVLPRSGSGRKAFDAFDCVPKYLKHSRQGGGNSADIAAARLRLIDAQRHDLEMRTREREGKLLPHDEVAGAFEAAMVTVGTQLDGLAGRMAGDLVAISDPAVMRGKVFDETRRIRNAAADQLEALLRNPTRRESAESAPAEEPGDVG